MALTKSPVATYKLATKGFFLKEFYIGSVPEEGGTNISLFS